MTKLPFKSKLPWTLFDKQEDLYIFGDFIYIVDKYGFQLFVNGGCNLFRSNKMVNPDEHVKKYLEKIYKEKMNKLDNLLQEILKVRNAMQRGK